MKFLCWFCQVFLVQLKKILIIPTFPTLILSKRKLFLLLHIILFSVFKLVFCFHFSRKNDCVISICNLYKNNELFKIWLKKSKSKTKLNHDFFWNFHLFYSSQKFGLFMKMTVIFLIFSKMNFYSLILIFSNIYKIFNHH